MSAPSGLRLSLACLTETPQRFQLISSRAWWEEHRPLFRDPESRLLEPFALDLEGYRLGNRLLFRGELCGVAELPCGRCLEPYAHAIRDRVELLLEPLPNPELLPEGAPEGGIELDPEDLEIGRYAGDELDFGVLLREMLLFDWPMQPRCAESCLGLCPSCGANRNFETCSCQGAQASGPFAALGELWKQSRRGDS